MVVFGDMYGTIQITDPFTFEEKTVVSPYKSSHKYKDTSKLVVVQNCHHLTSRCDTN